MSLFLSFGVTLFCTVTFVKECFFATRKKNMGSLLWRNTVCVYLHFNAIMAVQLQSVDFPIGTTKGLEKTLQSLGKFFFDSVVEISEASFPFQTASI